jgi:hypothetical protein
MSKYKKQFLWTCPQLSHNPAYSPILKDVATLCWGHPNAGQPCRAAQESQTHSGIPVGYITGQMMDYVQVSLSSSIE